MFLEKLKRYPKNIFLLVIAIIGLLIFLLVNIFVFVPINQLVPGYGILDFEFAWVSERVLLIFSSWGPSGMVLEALAIYWDFLYIVGYASFISGAILLITRRLEGKIQKVGLWMTLTPILAGILDVIENINLLIMLNNPSGFAASAPLIASICATIKFGFLFIAIGFALVACVILLLRKRKST